MFTPDRKQSVQLAMALAVFMAAVSGAAALTADQETTNSTPSSEVYDGAAITDLDNESKALNLSIKGDSNTNTSSLSNPGTAFQLKFVVNDSASEQNGTVLYNTSANWTQTAVANAPDHYQLGVDYQKVFAALERGANENVTIDAVVTFNKSESDNSSVTLTFTAVNGETHAVETFSGTAGETTLEETSNFTVAGTTILEAKTGAAKTSSDINVTSDTTTLTLAMTNDSVAKSWDAAVESRSSGDPVWLGTLKIGDSYIPVYSGSVGDEKWLDSGNETYAVYDASSDTLTAKNLNSTYAASTSSITVTAIGNEKLGFWNAHSMIRDYGGSRTAAATMASNAIDTNGDPFDNQLTA